MQLHIKTHDGTELGRRHTDDGGVVVVYDIIRGACRRTYAAAHKTPDGTELGRRHTDDDRVVVVYDIIRGGKPVFPVIRKRRIIKIIIRALENEDLRRGR
ncbi:hypothetical protein CEXT_724261 [Caerostris extrusa]|uniref:Uncharacterized protein n=1 Tax=Caerostris extrusa TaxID=172846 RepID=A0AAV4X0Q4_CAEEX|nr:hypothetical protein CEXT_724261 [Caerostris extrusa]